MNRARGEVFNVRGNQANDATLSGREGLKARGIIHFTRGNLAAAGKAEPPEPFSADHWFLKLHSLAGDCEGL